MAFGWYASCQHTPISMLEGGGGISRSEEEDREADFVMVRKLVYFNQRVNK